MALAVDGYRLGFVLSTGVATVLLVLIDGATRDGQYACREPHVARPHLNGVRSTLVYMFRCTLYYTVAVGPY
jgi:hypothetical protein